MQIASTMHEDTIEPMHIPTRTVSSLFLLTGTLVLSVFVVVADRHIGFKRFPGFR